MTGLRRLTADQEGQVDISAVGALTALERLNLVVPDVRSLAPLKTLTRLTGSTCRPAPTDISALAPLSRLQVLTLNVSGGDGAALAGKPDLTELSVYGVRLSSLDVLATSTGLSYLIVVSDGLEGRLGPAKHASARRADPQRGGQGRLQPVEPAAAAELRVRPRRAGSARPASSTTSWR